MNAVARLDREANRLLQDQVESFRTVDLSGLATACYSAPDYALQNLLPRGHVTLLGGHGGMGKSMLALTWAAHCAAGREWRGLYMAKVRSVYVSLEDAGDLVRLRLRNICAAYGLPHSDVEAAVTVLDGTDAAPALYSDYGRDLGHGPTVAWEELQEHASGAGLIVIDNASEGFAGNENDRRQVRGFMRALASLARDTGAAVVLLAHIDKAAARVGANGNSYSGSTAWHNSARSRLALVEESGAPLLRHEKLNLGRVHDPVALAFNDRGVLMPVTSASRAQVVSGDSRLVLAAITRVIEGGGVITTAMTGPATTYHAIEVALPEELRGKDGKRRVGAAVLRLQESGEIVRIAYTRQNRHPGERWELAQIDAATQVDGGAK